MTRNLRAGWVLPVCLAALAGGVQSEAGAIRYTVTDLGLIDATPRGYEEGSHPPLRFQPDGQVLWGSAEDSEGRYRATTLPAGSLFEAARVIEGEVQPLGHMSPGHDYSVASGVNEAGLVVGWSGRSLGGGMRDFGQAFVSRPDNGMRGRMEDLVRGLDPDRDRDLPRLPDRAYDINNLNDIVGSARISDDSEEIHAFLLRLTTGAIFDLNELIEPAGGWVVTLATAINDDGLIASYGRNPAGELHSLLLSPTPVPEPSVLALMGLVASAVGMRQVRSRWVAGATN